MNATSGHRASEIVTAATAVALLTAWPLPAEAGHEKPMKESRPEPAIAAKRPGTPPGSLSAFPERVEAERLYLRPYDEADGPLYYAAGRRNAVHLARFEAGNAVCHLESEAHATRVVLRLRAEYDAGTSLFLGIFDRASDDWAGQVYVSTANSELPEFTIGYVADVRYEGRGYVSEAVRAVLDVLFVRLAARRVRSDCNEQNERSWRLLERCGFAREGHLRENRLNPDGTLHGDYLYGLLRREHLADRRSAEGA